MTQVQSLCLWALGERHIERLALLQKLSEAALLGKVDAAGDPLIRNLGLDEVRDWGQVLLSGEFIVLDTLV